MVPWQLQNSLKEIHKIKKLIVGGGVVENSLLKKIKEIDTQVFATYNIRRKINRSTFKNKEKIKKEMLNLSSLSKYEIPKEVYFVDRFIETGDKLLWEN